MRDTAAGHAAAGRLAPAGDLPARRVRAASAQGTGAVRDTRIVIFGDASAGKTRFLYASLNSLIMPQNRPRRRSSSRTGNQGGRSSWA